MLRCIAIVFPIGSLPPWTVMNGELDLGLRCSTSPRGATYGHDLRRHRDESQWIASKGEPALESPLAGQRWPKNPRAIAGPACVVRRRSFEYGIIGMAFSHEGRAEPAETREARKYHSPVSIVRK